MSHTPVSGVAAYFAQFEGFEFDATRGIIPEFDRLCSERSWGKKRRQTARRKLNGFIAEEFNAAYGTLDNDLIQWQTLSRELRVEPVPDSVSQCKQAVKRIHVNIVDLLDARARGEQVRLHRNMHQLAQYSIRTGKIFPKKQAKAGLLLKYLLRQIY
ncbi:hypothetical protein PUNSTDRAFT_77588 [Punctularia strigosozonata HHB-11173 SS5]|uniref:Uncharacterized protein n=1 Tax=Punctularia strigosozonata (strain HHB-11173) TaxID=741275 RepID=R7S0M9_PUNST|nr:uncharacterized protein PUNSTDRAFT_77588 [Punctularia strigosozonata HHB-11173 SS5]EIN03758.1 hypothetical protein PUNSTDRAFT_77588 [Punctularia strigosozonata HHB-11173 SS5]